MLLFWFYLSISLAGGPALPFWCLANAIFTGYTSFKGYRAASESASRQISRQASMTFFSVGSLCKFFVRKFGQKPIYLYHWICWYLRRNQFTYTTEFIDKYLRLAISPQAHLGCPWKHYQKILHQKLHHYSRTRAPIRKLAISPPKKLQWAWK